MITHDTDGPFVRAANAAATEPQTEAVYGIRTSYADGTSLIWNAAPTPPTDEKVNGMWTFARRYGKDHGHGMLLELTRVARSVTLSATDWEEIPE